MKKKHALEIIITILMCLIRKTSIKGLIIKLMASQERERELREVVASLITLADKHASDNPGETMVVINAMDVLKRHANGRIEH